MADPIASLVAAPEGLKPPLSATGNSNLNQPVTPGALAFSEVLSGQPPGFVALAAGTLPMMTGTLPPGIAGQVLPADGKPLPDPLQQLNLAGLKLEGDELEAMELLTGQDLESLSTPPEGLPSAELPAAMVAAEQEALAETVLAVVPAQAMKNAGLANQVEAVEPPLLESPRISWPRDALPPQFMKAVPEALGQTTAETVESGVPVLQPAAEAARPVALAVQQLLQAQKGPGATREFQDLLRPLVNDAPVKVETPTVSLQPPITNTPATVPSLPALTVAVPVRQAGWDQALGDQVQWMVGQKLQGAEIRLNPAHLGPMEVRIQVQNDQANISFTAQHGVVREALEEAIPRLREMLSGSGLNLGNVDVSGQSFAQQRQRGSETDGVQMAEFPQEEMDGLEEPVQRLQSTLSQVTGGIDLFA